ncbi:MAG: hypothetical protein AAF694_13990 [Bacteroidota bacterium]
MILLKDIRLGIICFLLCFACSEEEPTFPDNSLAAYIADNSNLGLSNQLIACAAGGQRGFLEDPDFPVSVFFLPIEGAGEFTYFEAPISSNPDNFDAYQQIDLSVEPVFNGFLQRFLHPGGAEEKWSRVVYQTADSLHICNAIRIKLSNKPSEFAPELITIDLTSPTEPIFNWEEGRIQENAIYFQVVSDSVGNLISGTYTFDRAFQFYRLDNVVLNINEVSPEPILTPNQTYFFTLMGVSVDNWVNLIAEVEFETK